MSTTVLIALCILVLIAYVFDLTSSRTRIPSVILLLLLGWVIGQLTDYLGIVIGDLSPALPVLGTVGLILIVLEGSLELELHRSKSTMILKSLLIALFPMVLLAVGLAFAFQVYGGTDFRVNLVNAIPFCVISSAIAIPSVRWITSYNREFVTYESSFSDILGVLLFNFIALNEAFSPQVFLNFSIELLIIVTISFTATLGLALLLSKIEHHIKFIPIILLILLIYAVSKVYHLPGLIFILSFGLFIGNIQELKDVKWIHRLEPDELIKEVHKFKDLTMEGSFLVRTVFFILFGYLIDTAELFNADTFAWAVAITGGIFLLRAIHLKLFRFRLFPLLFIAPRGLITILLFLTIEEKDTLWLVNRSLLIQVVVLSALVMMLGLMTVRKPREETPSLF